VAVGVWGTAAKDGRPTIACLSP